jgi:LysR family glycine cleavage system transcriptional activator
MRLPPLGSIRAFEAAARHLSFTKAAAELGMTQAAVSWQIKTLESHLGQKLFLRQPRRLSLTAVGAALAPGVADAFLRLQAAFAAATLTATASAVLSISAVPTFANNWLVPRLGRFQVAHPGIAVRLDALDADEVGDFDRRGTDVAIRIGAGSWPGLVAHRLMPVVMTPVCRPDLLAGVETPADLMTLPLLQPFEMWQPWLEAAGVAVPRVRPTIAATFPRQHMAGRAAIAGQGVALLNPDFFDIPLGDGRLVRPFPIVWRDPARDYWLVYPAEAAAEPKIAAFRDWLMAEVSPMPRP